MAVLTIRGCDDYLAEALKRESRKKGISVNGLVIENLKASYTGSGKKPARYDDLDNLAGTWDEKEAADFEKIEPEAWKTCTDK